MTRSLLSGRGRWLAGLAGLAIAALVAVSIAAGSGTTDPAKAIGVSKGDALAKVASFASLSDVTGMTVGDVVDGAYSRIYEVRGPAVWATVDAHDGRIISMIFLGKDHAGPVALSEEGAIARAREFLDDHGVQWKGLNETVELRDRGEGSEYEIVWERRIGDVIVPDSRLVGIDAASGDVFRYNDTRHPYVDPGEPKISEPLAIEAARKVSGLGDDARVDKTELRLVFDAAGSQLLVWTIYLSAPVEGSPAELPLKDHVVVEVNADTGTGNVIGRG